jgi:hypothetical protein
MPRFWHLAPKRGGELATLVCKNAESLDTLRFGVVVRSSRSYTTQSIPKRRVSYRYTPCVYGFTMSKKTKIRRVVCVTQLRDRIQPCEWSARRSLEAYCSTRGIPVLPTYWARSLTNLNETQIAEWFNDISIPGPSL